MHRISGRKLLVRSDGGLIPFSWGGTLLGKTKQNQNTNLAKVPRGGVRNFPRFKMLACPTFVKRPIVFQGLFSKLSHGFWSPLKGSRHSRARSASPLCAEPDTRLLQSLAGMGYNPNRKRGMGQQRALDSVKYTRVCAPSALRAGSANHHHVWPRTSRRPDTQLSASCTIGRSRSSRRAVGQRAQQRQEIARRCRL
jgi:hypothetical protein